MSNEDQFAEMGTKPVAEHEWLKNLVGDWRTSAVMVMGPGGETMTSTGHEKVTSFGGLWAYGEGSSTMPGGMVSEYRNGLGYDVSFKEYRGFWIGAMSSHLWKQIGTLSPDGRTMTLDCQGPHMEKDGETANYRDVIELVDENTRTMTSYSQNDQGEWCEFMKVTFERV